MGLQKSGTTDKFTFYYQNKDHLGTVRETVTSTGAMKQRVNYYPFGGQLVDTLKAMVLNRDAQPYKYNGKEFDGTFGLNTYDYGARQHDPILARWDRLDPLCEKYYGVSPYNYCHNNPINAVDPDGRDDLFDENGKFIERTKTGDAVMVMCDGQYQNITKVDFSNNQGAIENIGRHYLAKADNGEFNLTVSSTGNGVPMDAALSNTQGTQNYDIYLTDGHVNKTLGNCYNFECVAFHESTHRYDSSTHGGSIGEVNAIIKTANDCPAWNSASDDYIQSQASYAARALNSYAKDNRVAIPNNTVHNLNGAFKGYAAFEINNNNVSVTNLLEGVTIWGENRLK